MEYTFKSERLGFRNWKLGDVEAMAAISADPTVMEFFPGTQSKEHVQGFIERMQAEFKEYGFCYFAVDRLEDGEMIGFIGLHNVTFEASFTPCVDIGWRLSPKAWGRGYATEGAKRCLEYAFNDLKLEAVKAIAPAINIKSINVMKKIGMYEVEIFKHPLLEGDERLEECVLFEINNLVK